MTAKRRTRKIKKRIKTDARPHPRLSKDRPEEAGDAPRVITKARILDVSISEKGLGCIHVEGESKACRNGCGFEGTFIVEDSEQGRFESEFAEGEEFFEEPGLSRRLGDHGERTAEDEQKAIREEDLAIHEDNFLEWYLSGAED